MEGVAWDRGCSWLHASNVNPWMDYARQAGFEVQPERAAREIYDGARRMDGAETAGIMVAIIAALALSYERSPVMSTLVPRY